MGLSVHTPNIHDSYSLFTYANKTEHPGIPLKDVCEFIVITPLLVSTYMDKLIKSSRK